MNRFILALIICLSAGAFATESIDKNVIKNVGNIHSVSLDAQQNISIYLPDEYAGNNQQYPVIYVLDGEKYFLHSIAYQKALTWQAKSPAFIVVGINTENLNRRELLGKKSVEFIDTLQNQIVGYVEKHYRTNNMKMYFGWEMAGGFALELFAKHPNLFDAYFLASSTHFTKSRLDNFSEVLKNRVLTNKFFYYTLGSVESWSLTSHEALSQILTNHSKKAVEWKFYLSKTDDHYSTPLDTFNKGLTRYFSDYSPIRFYTINEFKDFGGIKALKAHYRNRGKQYQISTDIHDDTKHYLLNLSVNEANFTFFKLLLSEFDGFIEGFNYPFGFIKKLGQFYVDNGATADAISLYKSELIKNPQSHELRSELAKFSMN
ncbi:alpha/beta hydrolase [Paraglaciecola arctica]|uniref:Esterase n=1 Tax=Paraglaciecola arctica BSs20135 TaxID=493475 RepID=K6ZDB6_9ALTE|nr:alpha/beta hydrolase-fold protein [Paraglaciecola arctica]GAC21405.1 hypothetical protein GARC_4463 [Paraglaciecola arctica BSs20135]